MEMAVNNNMYCSKGCIEEVGQEYKRTVLCLFPTALKPKWRSPEGQLKVYPCLGKFNCTWYSGRKDFAFASQMIKHSLLSFGLCT